ncbi:anaerobic ribonucleoside-triphosphate reductase activating protein [Abyssisolibacter fermentans]|uniref:anaerobic ribonucleoside-triphosphate reductase activating protein n=1 Tax=Abyssisolibacter fermentans TaxID=1766203 RepID=UPI00082A6C6D|nr:anaerobic ribonucleoside-triphosphate reductase activating protein [Abyssisolibacter fermentans]
MIFHGHIKSSFIDYPDKISTVLFTKGCNFRCSFCHNAELLGQWENELNEKYIFDFLNKRKNFIDAVCVSGGEVTLYPQLYDFLKKVKELGFLAKIDTNGTNPEMIYKLLNEDYIDYIAMDIKAPFEKYKSVVNADADIKKIKDSIEIIRQSKKGYEFRTTVCKELLSVEDIIKIAEYLKGSSKYAIQNFRDGDNVLVGKGKLTPFTIEELDFLKQKINNYFNKLIIR